MLFLRVVKLVMRYCLKKENLLFLVIWSSFCGAGPFIPEFSVVLTNSTTHPWVLTNPPLVIGCKITSDLSSYQRINPNSGPITVSGTCSDPTNNSIVLSYRSGDSTFSVGEVFAQSLTHTFIQEAYRTRLFVANGAKPGYFSCNILPLQKQVFQLILVGHFDRASVASYAKQIATNFSSGVMATFDSSVDGPPFTYSLSADNTKLTLVFNCVRLS